MPERITNSYKPLFEVRLLHHYWLDDGATIFDNIEEKKKELRLQKYDRRSFLSVRPTETTEKTLAACQCLYRDTALGFVVLAPANAQLAPETLMEFIVTVKDSKFYNYTALTLRPQRIVELFYEPENSTCRYKENVPVLSNLTGTSRGGVLYLSRDYPVAAANDPVEGVVKEGDMLKQLTSDGPGAATQQLGADFKEWPVFVHQGDVTSIVPPAGLAGVPGKGVRLTSDMADDVFAFLSLTAQRVGDNSFSFVDTQGKVKAVPPVYQVRFRNRSTFWKHIELKTGVEHIEANSLPLTHFGNAGTKQKPSDGLVKAEKSSTRITKLISEIYV